MIPIVSILVILFACQVAQTFSFAGEHGKGDRHSDRYEITKEDHDSDDHGRKGEKGDKGSEGTGQAAAWLFVLANLKVAFSVSTRFATRFFGSESRLMRSVIGLSQFLNKHLRKVHYLLNPAALVVAFLHFLLSSCRSTSLPEWGLLFVAAMVLLGLTLKWVPIVWIRKVAYRIHTGSATFLVVLIVLAGGHLMID